MSLITSLILFVPASALSSSEPSGCDDIGDIVTATTPTRQEEVARAILHSALRAVLHSADSYGERQQG